MFPSTIKKLPKTLILSKPSISQILKITSMNIFYISFFTGLSFKDVEV